MNLYRANFQNANQHHLKQKIHSEIRDNTTNQDNVIVTFLQKKEERAYKAAIKELLAEAKQLDW